MLRKWFSHCGKITDNFPWIHPVRGRHMFETLIVQECFIFLKMWQKTFSTINSGGKKWRNKWIRPRAPVQKAKLEQKTRKSKTYKWNCQSSSIKSFQRRSRNWDWHWNQLSDSVTILKIIEILKPRHFWQSLFPDIYWNWISFAIVAVSICRHSMQKWFREPFKNLADFFR